MAVKLELKPRPLSERVSDWTDETTQSTARKASLLFTRLGLDAKVPDSLIVALERARVELGLNVYAERAPSVSDSERECNAGVAIIPIAIDEPLQPRLFQSARQVEFQFIAGRSAQLRQGSQRSDWAPSLPSDLATASQLTQRVELVRQMCEDPNARIGGAIAAAAVEDDLRYLIDCGLDYVCILADACFGTQPAERVSFCDAEHLVEQTLSVIDASGRPDVSLYLAAANSTPERALRWIRMGVHAVGIDGWLQSKCPPSPSRSSDGFGGFLVEVIRPNDRTMEWLTDAVRDFLSELASELSFAGYRMPVKTQPEA